MPIDRSGTITTGGQSQQLAPDDNGRGGMFLQNNSSGDLWVRDGAAASAASPSLKIESGAYYEWPYPPRSAVHIYGASTGQAFTCREY